MIGFKSFTFFAGRRRLRRRMVVSVVMALSAGSLTVVLAAAAPSASAAGSPCGANVNPIACENSQTSGVVSQDVWDTPDGDAGDDTIQGFATDISVNAGSPVSFKIKTTLNYSIDIYRLGWYGGNGARLWQGNLSHSAPVNQPACLTDPSTQLYDCGNWSVSATWNVPSNAVSGVYLAKLTATNGDNSQITFVVRNDASTADIVYQTSDPTWEAYNTYGGADFYTGPDSLTGSQARAFKISYNRPFATRSDNAGRDFLFSNEYPTIRFLERNGYDTTYIAGVDSDRYGSLLKNHKVFLSVGHDEYWSAAQRANVLAARDAGVNLMFLSGNEVYWHTRYESSIDSSHTAYRTLVSYKETWDNAKIDPTPEWTGTWRDPRFADAPGGASPENGLTGTMYMSQGDDQAVTVTAAQGKTRLWRNTGLSSMGGSSTALAPHTVGYETDEDVDNGFRPAGEVDLSTTVFQSPQRLQDFGTNVLPGTTTHHLTLYRAPSGALVFGAGTIQWAWGLDQDHDGDNSSPADSRMQQATANMLADMHALPTTLMSGLVMPTPSSDTQAPTVTITSPTSGTLANGSQVTVTGTASDNGGGQVAGVEVSLDGGSTWHPATGTTSWNYSGILQGDGAGSIKVRATDDSANTSSPVTANATSSCPCSLFGNMLPATPDAGDSTPVELGVRFTPAEDGYITGVRFYKAATNTGAHVGTLWTSAGALLATGSFTNETASGWQTLQFAQPVAVTAGTSYVASYWAPNGHYSNTSSFFYYRNFSAPPLAASRTAPDQSTINGLYSTSHSFPTSTYQSGNYFVDVTFSPSATIPPSVTGVTPSAGASSVSAHVTPTAVFSKPINSSTISFTLTDPNNATVPATVTYDSASRTATLTPNAALADGTLYTASITAKDTNGNAMPAPYTWNFRTAYSGQVGGSCPCTLFTDSTVPAIVTDNEAASVELGIKFTADTDGVVTGVRFYKGPQNVGTHTGSLWTASGTQLATATFTNESSTGWQTVTFATPVSITAGTTYVASYHTTVGFYSATVGAYSSAGFDNFPLHVPVNGGMYSYAGGFPNSTSSADYGVDVVFTVPASVVPKVTATDPADGDTNIGSSTPVTVQFSTSVLAGTTTVAMTQNGGGSVAGTTALDAVHQTLTFTPNAALAQDATYTVTVSGARTLSGTLMDAPVSWSFSTSGSTCPCTLFPSNSKPAVTDSGDGSALSLGTQFVPSQDGYITAVRFYKSAANTGAHTGSIWSASGTRLSTVTFSNETSSGWQKATLSHPVAVTAGTTYVVSYYAPNGHYSYTTHYFDSTYSGGTMSVPGGSNGLYQYGSDSFPTNTYGNANYWVDVVFSTSAGTDSTPPSVASTTPIDGSTSVSTAVNPSAQLTEPIDPATLVMTVKSASGTNVAGTASFDSSSNVATFDPSGALDRGVKYTVSLTASDTAGNAMANPYTWSFTTAQPSPQPGVCPCSVWDDAATPDMLSSTDTRSVELGVQFTSDQSGQITGMRFYKGAKNIGTHVGTLWSASGQQLATGTFTGESTQGWQTLTFATPVLVSAGTTYVVSYHASNGGFSATSGMFASNGVDNAPLHVPAHAGLYVYGDRAFPTTASDANYWVDPVFNQYVDTTPPVISAINATASGSSATITWTTDENSTSRVDYGTSASSLTSSATSSGLSTSHSVTLSGLGSSTTYYFRVSSVDAAGNGATSPASPAAPSSFVSADTVPPVITAVSAAARSGSATVTWTTDESSTSRVDYGTSATSLTSNATSAGSGTAHSVTLSGLAANTTYYYRVTSADGAGNAATSPASPAAPATFTTLATSVGDATTADFNAGTVSSAYVAQQADGEVVLAPSSATEFTGTTVPSGMSTTIRSGGSVVVNGGVATLLNADLTTTTTYSNGRSLEVGATLGRNQSIGWVTSSNSNVKMSFSVNTSNQLVATVNDGFFNSASSTVATGWTAAPHKFRIEWTSSSATFYLDDVQKYTHSFTSFYSNLRPLFSDTGTTDGSLVVDWSRVGPYASSGTFTSRVLDAKAVTAWGALTWDATVPSGTTLTVQVRSGNTATPDSSWTAFATVPSSGSALNRTSRYLQYRLTLTSSGNRFVTPTVRSVTAALPA
jgi:hypothetical protein